jgi:PAS domain S-box-containing protein
LAISPTPNASSSGWIFVRAVEKGDDCEVPQRVDGVIRARRPNGSCRAVRSSSVRHGYDRPSDARDRERARDLHGAEEPYRDLVEQMREGAVVLAQSGDILYANARFAALVGEPLESVLGGHIGRFISEADRTDLVALLSSGSGTHRSRLISSSGRTIEVYLSLTTTVSKGAGSLSLIVTDLSALLEARSDRDRAERDSHTTNEFLTMLGHELRNPLGAIRSAVGVLECVDPKNGPAIRAREVIARQVGHLSHLIDDLLDVERVASGKIRLDRHPLDGQVHAGRRTDSGVIARRRQRRSAQRSGHGVGHRARAASVHL